MFSFFHRKNKLTLDCFTVIPEVYNCTPIVKTSKTIPDWWKSLPNPGIGNALENPGLNNNMRRCYGFVELMKRGCVLENWADLHLRVDDIGFKYYTACGVQPGDHNRSQFAGAFNKCHHLKLNSPWFLREKTGNKFLFLGAEWQLDDYNFKVLPGVVEYKVNSATNVNIMLPVAEQEYDIYLKVGQPLVQIIPLDTSVELEVKNHLIDEFELGKIQRKIVSFKGLREQLSLLSRNEKRKNAKCPFH